VSLRGLCGPVCSKDMGFVMEQTNNNQRAASHEETAIRMEWQKFIDVVRAPPTAAKVAMYRSVAVGRQLN